MPRSLITSSRRSNPLQDRFTSLAVHLLRLPRLWWRRHCYRRELSELLDAGPHFISDIGLTPEDVEEQSGKPFWRGKYLPPLRPF